MDIKCSKCGHVLVHIKKKNGRTILACPQCKRTKMFFAHSHKR